jgi:hypothetical protein
MKILSLLARATCAFLIGVAFVAWDNPFVVIPLWEPFERFAALMLWALIVPGIGCFDEALKEGTHA